LGALLSGAKRDGCDAWTAEQAAPSYVKIAVMTQGGVDEFDLTFASIEF
jgi:hypothetical protein